MLTLTLSILIAGICHELAHGYVAYRLGDPTAKHAGRLTVNPLPHLDLWGTILVPAALLAISGGKVVFGWLRAMPVNQWCFANSLRGMFYVALAGPAVNLFLSCWAWVSYLITGWEPYLTLSSVNTGFAIFNLLPVKPLDGWHVARYLLGHAKTQKSL